jgi:hypothetical protein
VLQVLSDAETGFYVIGGTAAALSDREEPKGVADEWGFSPGYETSPRRLHQSRDPCSTRTTATPSGRGM